MAKRFTDTTKWRRPWFRNLNSKAKLSWIYICDECDHAGIFIADFDLMSFQLGFDVTRNDLLSWFGEKINFFDHDKIFIPSFFKYQYGKAKPGFKAKQSAVEILKSFKLIKEDSDIEHLDKCSGDSIECPSISISKGISNNINNNITLNFEEIYNAYPRKVGKAKGHDVFKREIKTLADFENLRLAVEKYTRHVTKEKTEAKYIKHFSTFMNSWRDWLDPDAGTAISFSETKPKGIEELLAEDNKI